MIKSVKKQPYTKGNLDKYGRGDCPLPSSLILNLKNIHGNTNFLEIFANTIRRIAYEYIPSYAFYHQLINIRKNTSVTNNDYMRLRLSHLPIMNIQCDVSYLLPEYCDINNYTNDKRIKHNKDNKEIGIYINATNNSMDIINITTDDIELYINGEKLTYTNQIYPILLVQLRPGEEFECEMDAVLGIGDNGVIWSPVTQIFYNSNDDRTELTLTIKSNGQFDEYEILIKICNNVIYKIGEIEHYLSNYTPEEKDGYMEISLVNNNYTLCNIINWFIQSYDDISYSGITKPDYANKIILFKIGGKNPFKYFKKALKDVVILFINFGKEIYKHGKENIRSELMELIK